MALNSTVTSAPAEVEAVIEQYIGPQVQTEDLNASGSITINGVPVGGGGSAEWGDITGTLSDQTDLQSALDDKAPVTSPTFVTSAVITAAAGTAATETVFSSTNTPTLASNIFVARSRDNSGDPDVPQAGDSLGFFSGVGFDGTNFNFSNCGGMEFRATENFSPTNLGTELRFFTVGTGGSTNFGLMQMGHNGTNRYLNLGTSGGGLRLTYDGSSTNNRPIFQATSGTNTNIIYKPPGATASDSAGIRIDSSSSASTFDFLSLAATGTSTSKYRIVIGTVTAGTPSDATEDLVVRGGGTGTVYASIGPVDGVKTDVALKPPAATLATLPDATTPGRILFVSDANSAVGTICFSDGTDWIDVKTGAAVA